MSRPLTHPQAPAPTQAEPELAELQQTDSAPVVVPVRQDGPVETHELPSRQAPAFEQTLEVTLRSVLSGLDLKRKRALLLGDDVWIYSHSASSPGVRWPADVPLVITHGDAVYAAAHPDAQGVVTLSVIAEVWAD
jgi:hypothetical protein